MLLLSDSLLRVDGGETRKSDLEIARNHQLVVLIRNVALHLALVDEIGQNALTRVRVARLVPHILERLHERLDGYLRHAQHAHHRLEQVPVGCHAQLFQKQIHPVLDEKVLVLEHVLVELDHVAALDRLDDLRERLEVVLLEESARGHVAAQHVDRNQVDENETLVAFEFARTVVVRIGEIGGGRVEVVLEHGLTAHVEFVNDLMALRKRVLHVAVLDHTLKRVAQVDLVDFEVDLEQLIDQVHHSPAFGHLFSFE